MGKLALGLLIPDTTLFFKHFHIIQVLLCMQLSSFQVNKRLYCNEMCFCSKAPPPYAIQAPCYYY